jgi:hypothetical protein
MKAKETAEHHAYNTVQPNRSTLLNTAKETVVWVDLRIKKVPMKEAVKE